MSAPEPLSRAERRWWREAPTLVAVGGLLAALVFNTVGVWLQLGQAEQARENTALALLTQLNGLARQAEGRITEVREAICAGNLATAQEQAALTEAAQNYDYLAWLFNAGHIRMRSASDYWAPNMLEAYELAVQQHGLPTAQKRFPELNDFKFASPKGEWVVLAESCQAIR